MKKTIMILIMISIAVLSCFARAIPEAKTPGKYYVASTSWVASIAELAGIDNVDCIAPANLRHPPEYEITAEDMVKVKDAELILNAGYEAMMKVISNAAEVDSSKIVKVKTTNTEANLSAMVEMLSNLAGTQEEAEKRYSEYKDLIEKARQLIREKGYDKFTVWAHADQAEFARDLGLNVVGTFGRAQLSAEQIAEAALNNYDIVIDNAHNPVASPVAEVSPSSVILLWSNFPDHLGNNALYNVLKGNLEMLFKL